VNPTFFMLLLAASFVQEALHGDTEWSADRVARRALEVDPGIGAARLDAEAAAFHTEEAEASILPRVALSARFTRLTTIDNDPLVSLPGGTAEAVALASQVDDPEAQALWLTQLAVLEQSVIEIPENQGAFRASIAYPVTALFFEILPGIQARKGVEAARVLETEVARRAAELTAVETYFLHARARAADAVAKVAVAEARQNLERAEARFREGASAEPEVLRFRARLAEARGVQAERRAQVEASAEALRALLDLKGRGRIGIAEPVDQAPALRFSEPIGTLIERAQQQRAEVRAVTRLAEARRTAAGAAGGAAVPRLSVSAEILSARPNPSFVPPGDGFRTNGAASVVLQWSPDGAWAASRRARRTRREAARIEAQRSALLDQIRIEVSRFASTYRASFERFEASTAQRKAAESAYAARLESYGLGLSEGSELLEASLDLDRARLAVIDAGVQIRVREAQLMRALGESRVER
jgi:outer membrane protein TolC